MLDKREELSTKVALLIELIFCTHNMRLPHVRYEKLPQSNEKVSK